MCLMGLEVVCFKMLTSYLLSNTSREGRESSPTRTRWVSYARLQSSRAMVVEFGVRCNFQVLPMMDCVGTIETLGGECISMAMLVPGRIIQYYWEGRSRIW